MGKYAFFGGRLDRCESPIERHFLAGLLVLVDVKFEPYDFAPEIAVETRTGVILGMQVTCAPYRIDFTLTHPASSISYAIELDGYAYHGSRPDQFERDAVRQRALTEAGWTILRFAGREIVRDAKACAQRVMQFAETMADTAHMPDTPPAWQRPVSNDPEVDALLVQIKNAEGDWHESIRLAQLLDAHIKRKHGYEPIDSGRSELVAEVVEPGSIVGQEQDVGVHVATSLPDCSTNVRANIQVGSCELRGNNAATR